MLSLPEDGRTAGFLNSVLHLKVRQQTKTKQKQDYFSEEVFLCQSMRSDNNGRNVRMSTCGLTVKFVTSPPCSYRGSTGQKP